jgi:hypothetical protein
MILVFYEGHEVYPVSISHPLIMFGASGKSQQLQILTGRLSKLGYKN